MKRTATSFIFVIAALLVAQIGAAQIPGTLSLQGVLNDDTGEPVADGPYDLTFRLYDVATGGSVLWTEAQTLTTSNGVFDAALGSVTALTLDFENEYWIGIELAGESEMAPRVELTSAAYALIAGTVEDVAITSEKIADDAVTNPKLADDSVASNNIQDDTVVRSLNTLQDDVQLVAGTNVTIATNAAQNKITISAAGGGGGTCTTLDEAYDCATPGAGRTIIVDSGAVKLDGTTANQTDILEVIAGPNAAAGIDVTQNSQREAIGATTLAAGNGVPVISAVHHGVGAGVYGRTGVAAVTNPAPKSGVAGESKLDTGVSGSSDDGAGVHGRSLTDNGVFGRSRDKNGVEGNTEKSGTWAAGVPANLVGGVLGRAAESVDSADNFAVIGNARDYGGIGVFGLGGREKGHGVMGMSGDALPDRANAGVRGVTYEGVFPPTHWSLDDMTSKLEVGVLGQANERVAVWGESGAKFGVVGTTGLPKGLGELPGEGPMPGEPAGVYGMSDTELRNGVHGYAFSENEDDAGVVAEGDGINSPGDPRAAALEIRNGAIRVSGIFRPADTVAVPGPSFPIVSCDFDGHRHIIGHSEDMPIDNPLAKPDSIILVSIQGQLPLGYQATVQILRRDAGSFRVRYAILGDQNQNCQPPSTPLTLHYQIINPFPAGAQ